MSYSKPNNLQISGSAFGRSPSGDDIALFTLTNAAGMTVKITDFGGVITEIYTPDKHGKFADIVLGFTHVEPYFEDSPYFGALVGRYGNRIANGQFILNNQIYKLAINNGVNHLHGGIKGFDKVVWDAKPFMTEASVGLILKYTSIDGEEGYPGNLHVSVTYQLTNNNEIITEFCAVTDKATPVNLTQHTYFNLTGFQDDNITDVLSHLLELNADKFIPVNVTQIPTGEIESVANTPFDFRTPHAIGDKINTDDQQIKNCLGYDHTFVLNKNANELCFAACVTEPQSGRVLELFTKEPGVQFYSGNFLDGTLSGKGHRYSHRSGFCLEPQHFPNSPNQPNFPNTILQPGQKYTSTMKYKFSVVNQL